jgi:hypothetical protein
VASVAVHVWESVRLGRVPRDHRDGQLVEPPTDDPAAAFVCLACGRVFLETTNQVVRTVKLRDIQDQMEQSLLLFSKIP